MGDDDVDILLTTADLARITKMSIGYFEDLRRKGDGPKFIRVGKRGVRYPRRDFETWLAENQR